MTKKALVGALAAGVLAVPAPAAMAASTVTGGCFLYGASNDLATNDVYVLGALAIARDAGGAPAQATIACAMRINGADVPGGVHHFSGFGVVAGARQPNVLASDSDVVEVCQSIDGGTWTCRPATTLQFPPSDVVTVVKDLNAVLSQVTDPWPPWHDPFVCASLKTLMPPEGDVRVPDPLGMGLGPVWDCPPYDSQRPGARLP